MTDSIITIHPMAISLLFSHFKTIKKIYQDVLGQLELDYLCIALLTPGNQLIFFSSKPSVEHNLIEKELWQFDGSYCTRFITQNMPKLWETLYSHKHREALRYYKQQIPKLSMGIAIPSEFAEYRVIYSCGTKSANETVQMNLIEQAEILRKLGQYCLQRILTSIELPDRSNCLYEKKPILTLIINNEVKHEKNT